jgi:Peroxiredoxin
MPVTISHRGTSIEVDGNLPVVGSQAPDFKLTANDLSEITLADYAGKT